MNKSIWERYPELKTIPKDKFPKHILIIPDGNGRWAKNKNLPVLYGHKKGAEVMEKILNDLQDLHEVTIVTIWGFSADNWKRGKDEVKKLFQIISIMVKKKLSELIEKNIKFKIIGREDRMPKNTKEILNVAEKETEKNSGQTLCIAVDFGGEDQEIRMLEKAKTLPENLHVSKKVMESLRDGEGKIPPADLLIRTSGEQRTSDIGWLNGAGTELYFITKLFPDITTEDIVEAIISFSKRHRRLGSR